MRFVDGVPAILVGVSDDDGWVSYQDGYIEFAAFDEEGTSAERLSHWIHWGEEPYPQTEIGIVEVMTRVLDALHSEES